MPRLHLALCVVGAAALSARTRTALTGGSLVALPTPMAADGALDLSALRNQVEWHCESGTAGIVALGTTGEASMVTDEERDAILRTTVEVVGGRIPVVAGTGTIDTRKTIDLAARAADLGCDAHLVVTPYYVKPPQAGLVKHFTAIADAVDLPMILYNVPGRTGCDLVPETVGHLSDHPRIVGVKEATGDLTRVSKLLALCDDDFLLYSGDDETGLQFCLDGGDGVISVTAAVAPREMQSMIEAAGIDVDTARVINSQLGELHKKLFVMANPIPVKWALHRYGKIGPGIRSPLVALDPSFRTVVEDAMRAAKLDLP